MSVDIDVLKSKNPLHCFPDGSPKDYPEIMDKSHTGKEKSRLFIGELYSWHHGQSEAPKEKDQRAREAGH